MAVAYNPSTIDWSQLATMGQNIGGALGQRNLGIAMRDAIVDGKVDYDKMAAIFAERQPAVAAKMAMSQQDAANRYGLNLVFDENGNAYQPMTGGGLAPVSGEGGAKLAAPQTWKETPDGYVPVPSRGPMGAPAVRPVGTYDVKPDGTMSPTAVPSLGAQKQKHDLASQHATDKALAQNSIDKLEEGIANFNSLVDESGNATEGLKAITGTNAIGIPKAWLPDVSQEARNASAKLKTSAIQVGLNTLEQMRAMSAQGASGMGQLAIQESIWLQNSIRSLQETQDPAQIAKHIQEIKENSRRAQARIREKYKEIYQEDLTQPSGYQSPAAAPAPSGGSGDDPLGLF